MAYKTSDGSVYGDEAEARKYQNKLDAQRAVDMAKHDAKHRSAYDAKKDMITAFNACIWDAVIEKGYLADEDKCYAVHGIVIDKMLPAMLLSIAKAHKENNYTDAFKASKLFLGSQSEKDILCPAAIKAGKEAFKRVHGREITDTELNKIVDSVNQSSFYSYSSTSASSSNGKINGMGKITKEDGTIYEGYFVDGNLKNGKETSPDGFCYEGDYEINKKFYNINQPSGKGKAKYTDGSMYEGDFKNGVPHGKGVMTYPDGKVEKGNFKDGEYKKGLFG